MENEITIQQFIDAKKELEVNLGLVIQGVVSEFEIKTGYTPGSIKVDMVDTTCMGDGRTHYVVGEIHTDFNI